MYAWRARIGLIKPTHRGKTFAFWYKYAADGVEIVPTFIGFRSGHKDKFLEGFQRAEEIAIQLKEVGCDIIQVSGTPPFLLKGLDFERQWASDLSKKIGLPVVTAVEPHPMALKAMGVKKVAIATYFGDELNQAIVSHFSRFGLQSFIMPGFSGTAATPFNVDSDTQMTATVPTGATTGKIGVTTAGGTGLSATTFIVSTLTSYKCAATPVPPVTVSSSLILPTRKISCAFWTWCQMVCSTFRNSGVSGDFRCMSLLT